MTMKAIVLILSLASPALADPPPCGPRDVVLNILADRYHESVRVRALTQDGNLLELTAAESGAWTVVTTSPAGMSCLVSTGEAFTPVEPALAGVMD